MKGPGAAACLGGYFSGSRPGKGGGVRKRGKIK